MSFENHPSSTDEEQQTPQEAVHVAAASGTQEEQEEQQRLAAEDELAEELARLKRLGIFSTFIAALMMTFVFLPLVYFILLLLAGIWYAFSPCLYVLLWTAATTQQQFQTPPCTAPGAACHYCRDEAASIFQNSCREVGVCFEYRAKFRWVG